MAFPDNMFGLTIMAFILIFSLIHLGVSVGIIAPYRQYQDVFRPQIGLASFNLVICIFGFLTGGLGLFAVLKQADRFGRVVVLIAGTLAVFTIASLITALVINSKSLSYLNSHYTNHMNLYRSNADSRMIIDNLHDRYDCCGSNLWLDWAQAGLDTVTATSTTANTASTTTTTTTNTTTNTTTTTTTTGSGISTTATPIVTTQSPSTTSAVVVRHGVRKRDVHQVNSETIGHRRHSRQAMTNYISIPNLPTTLVVTLPSSCCQSIAVFANNTGYCRSANNGTENKIRSSSCLKPMDVTAGNHAMGIGVINCFMIVLSIIAIPILMKSPGPYI